MYHVGALDAVWNGQLTLVLPDVARDEGTERSAWLLPLANARCRALSRCISENSRTTSFFFLLSFHRFLPLFLLSHLPSFLLFFYPFLSVAVYSFPFLSSFCASSWSLSSPKQQCKNIVHFFRIRQTRKNLEKSKEHFQKWNFSVSSAKNWRAAWTVSGWAVDAGSWPTLCWHHGCEHCEEQPAAGGLWEGWWWGWGGADIKGGLVSSPAGSLTSCINLFGFAACLLKNMKRLWKTAKWKLFMGATSLEFLERRWGHVTAFEFKVFLKSFRN